MHIHLSVRVIPVNTVVSSPQSYLLRHARSQQHVNTLLDGCSDFSVASRQMRQQRLPVDPLAGEA